MKEYNIFEFGIVTVDEGQATFTISDAKKALKYGLEVGKAYAMPNMVKDELHQLYRAGKYNKALADMAKGKAVSLNYQSRWSLEESNGKIWTGEAKALDAKASKIVPDYVPMTRKRHAIEAITKAKTEAKASPTKAGKKTKAKVEVNA